MVFCRSIPLTGERHPPWGGLGQVRHPASMLSELDVLQNASQRRRSVLSYQKTQSWAASHGASANGWT